MSEIITTLDWAHVVAPGASGRIKLHPEDFLVDEILGFELEGEGEHLYLQLEKRGLNTQELVTRLARALMLHPKNISYAGLKDRQAVTRQWISVRTPRDIDINTLQTDEFKVLQSQRHSRKLKKGAHRGNRFEIVVREFSDRAALEESIVRVSAKGVPNYFGDQRFGRKAGNIPGAYRMFAGQSKPDRYLKSMYLSAARAFLFNQVVSERVSAGSWATALPGEALVLDGSNSFFKIENPDDEIVRRLAGFDIHPSAPMWGKGESAASLKAHEFEQAVVWPYPELRQGLEQAGLRQQRRPTRLLPRNLVMEQQEHDRIKLCFELARGTFATTVMRELITIPISKRDPKSSQSFHP